MDRIARRAPVLWLLVLLLLGGVGFFLVEYFMNAGDWVVSSPHISGGDNLVSGTVTDRDGIVLLKLDENKTYSTTEELRKAVIHWVGDRRGNISTPVINRYGRDMAGFDEITGVFSYTGEGQMYLTLSEKVQLAAQEAMGSHKGTVAVYNYKTGEILCAVSTPNYDPINEPDIGGDTTGAYDAVYVNRFTQSVYIPGSIFKIVTTAAALEEIPDIREQTFTCNGSREYGVDKVTCEEAHGTLDLVTAMRRSCNCSFAAIADQLGGETLQKYVERYRLIEPLSFDGVKTAAGNFRAEGAAPVQVAWSSIGQHKDQINPARFLEFLGAVANGGKGVEPHIVKKVTDGNKTTYTAKAVKAERIMPAEIAAEVQQMMRNNVENYYGDSNFPGLKVCAKTGTAEVGGDKAPNAMFAGFVMDEEYPLAFLVAVEEGGYGRQTCLPIAAKVLAVCKEMMDGQ